MPDFHMIAGYIKDLQFSNNRFSPVRRVLIGAKWRLEKNCASGERTQAIAFQCTFVNC